FAVTDRDDFRYFPPFRPGVNVNSNRHLGAEYINIAKSIRKGDGFANPFPGHTGPTAWMPPILPGLLAGLLWACDDDRDAVMVVVIFLQVLSLIATGVLAVALARRTGRKVGTWAAVTVFLAALVTDFRMCFQLTHDSWLVLLVVNLLVAWLCWGRPLGRRWSAVVWGLFGGVCALVNPILALVWGAFSALLAWRQRAVARLALAALAAGLTLAPWAIRNYLVLGRLIPVKSNLAYELYQSQCLQRDGLIQRRTFHHHPYGFGGRERQEYRELGEIAYIDRKREQFWESVRSDPIEFVDRAATRFLG